MKKFKAIVKILSLVIVITSLTTLSVFAEDKIEGDELIGFETESTTYTTPDVSKITRTAFNSSFWGPNLTTLNIGKGVKEVGHFTFYYSYDETPLLETVNMEDVEIIGDFAFGGLKYLKTVKTADELKEIKSAAFTNLLALKSIDLQNLERLGNQAFEGAGLVEVTVPGTVKKVEFQAFNLMPNLEKVTVEEGVEELEKYSFQSYKFKEIHLPASLTKIDDFAISGNKGGLTIYAPAGSYAEKWAQSKSFTVKAEGSTTTTQPQPTQPQPQPTQPTTPISVSEMTPYNYTDKNAILNTEWGIGKSKNVVKVEEENVIFHNSPQLSDVYNVETWNKESYITRKYKFTDFDYCYQYYYVKKDGELHLAFSNTEGPFENRIELVENSDNTFAGVLVARPDFEAYLPDNEPSKALTEERWSEEDVGEVYILIDYKYSNDDYMIDVQQGKRLIKLDLRTGEYPEPIKKEIVNAPVMTAENYNMPEIMVAADQGLSDSRNVVKIENEYLDFDQDEIAFKDGYWDVETWNKDTYATYLTTVNINHFYVSYNYFVKINGKLYLASNDEPTELKSTALFTAYEGTRSGLTEVLESGVISMKPEFSIWKYNYANPFDIGTQRWTEKNVGEVYVGFAIDYYPYEFSYGAKKDVLMPATYFFRYKMIKLGMSDNSTSTNPTIETALQTSSKVMVDGEEVRFNAYNINGNNYFKLRDLALVVNKTDKQFAVEWDGIKNSINLISNKEYSPTHGELIPGNGAMKYAKPTTSKLYKDGSLVSWVGYNIDDNNYYKLRDLGKAFNIEIDWDNDTQTVVIDTTRSYTED